VTFFPGQIVLVDWRDALPKEPNKLRPAVIVEDADLFHPNYPNLIVVPFSIEVIAETLAVEILPTPENGCPKRCWALANQITATSKQRVSPTGSRITDAQLAAIRRLVARCIGLRA